DPSLAMARGLQRQRPGRGSPPRPFSKRVLSRSDSRGNAMSLASVFAVTLLAAAPRFGALNGNDAQPSAFINAASGQASPKTGASMDSPRPKYNVGNKAPDFQYQSYDDLWQSLH